MARPKQENRKHVTLSVDKDKLKKAKEISRKLQKSLSRFTEDCWGEAYKNIKDMEEDPSEALLRFKVMIDEAIEKFKYKKEQKERIFK